MDGRKERVWLRDIMKAKNIPRHELARLANMSPITVHHIELGYRNPSIKKAQRIAEILDFDFVLFYKNEV